MKLPEFISYCVLRDIVVFHEILDPSYPEDPGDIHKLIIEVKDYLATITYNKHNDNYKILYTELKIVTVLDDLLYKNINYNDIVEVFA